MKFKIEHFGSVLTLKFLILFKLIFNDLINYSTDIYVYIYINICNFFIDDFSFKTMYKCKIIEY